MAPPTNIRTKKGETAKQNVVSGAQAESSKPSKRKKEVNELSEGRESKKKAKKDEAHLSKPTKALKAMLKETDDAPEESKKPRKGVKKDEGHFAKASKTEPEVSSVGEDEDGDGDDAGHLHGFSTDDDDSSDDEDATNDEPSAFDVSKLPTIAKDDATVKRKLEKAKRQPTEDRGVLFIGRLPHGFYEDQLKAYFAQFGNVTRLRVSRNKKTGKSKHYGFIEFDSSSVASIVADTMDNYLIMGHILRCKLIPKDQVHPELWVGANRKWRAVPRDRLVRIEHNKPRTELEQIRTTKRLLKRQNERKRKLAQAGVKYDFEAVSYKKVES